MSAGFHVDYGDAVAVGLDDDGEACLVVSSRVWADDADRTVTFSAPPGSVDRSQVIDQLVRTLEALR